jgi:hypothetical protein
MRRQLYSLSQIDPFKKNWVSGANAVAPATVEFEV